MKLKLFAPLLFIVMLAGCPPASNTNFQRAAQASLDFALADQAFQNVVVTLHHASPPLIGGQEDIKLETLIKKMAQIDEDLANGVQLASKGVNTQAQIQVVLDEISALDKENLDFIINTKAKVELQSALVAARSILLTVTIILGK